MYNEEVKNAYLSTLEPVKLNKAKNLFEKSSMLEDFKNKDLAKFTKKDILYLFTSLKTISIESLRQKNNQIRSYKEWYKNNFQDKEIIQFEITKTDYQECLDKNRYFTEEMTDKITAQQKNPFTKFIIRAIFEGIRGENLSELVFAKITDINKDEHKMKVYNCESFDEDGKPLMKEREIIVSDKLILFAEECCNSCEIQRRDGLTAGYLEDNGYIIKDKKNMKKEQKSTYKQIRAKAATIRKRLTESVSINDLQINPTFLFYSGIIDELKKGINESRLSFIEKQYNISRKEIEKIEDNFIR